MLDSVFDRLRFKGRTERVFQLFSSRMGNGGFPCDRWFVVSCSAGADPLIDLGELELPQAADPVSRQPLVLDPTVDRVLGDAQMLGYSGDGDPCFGGH
jgi:hypothetical protein